MVQKMRQWQRSRMVYNGSNDRYNARKYEQEVDGFIKEEKNLLNSKQKELF